MAVRVTTKVELNERELRRQVGGALVREVDEITRRVTIRATNAAPVGSGRDPRRSPGRIKRSHRQVRAVQRGTTVAGAAQAGGAGAPHAIYQHEGTGGSGRKRIRPRTADFLTFYGERSGRFVRARSVAGSKPNPWLKRAGQIVAAERRR